MNDGNIRIGIKITDADKQIKSVDNKIKILNNKINNLGKQKLPLQDKLKDVQKQIVDNAKEGLKFGLGAPEINKRNEKLNETAASLKSKIDAISLKESEIGIKLSEQKDKRQILLDKHKQLQLQEAKEQIGLQGIGNEVNKVTKKVVKWGLAIFGVRSAYMFVRQAMGNLTQYDKQLGTDIEYIRYALSKTIKPIIDWIVKQVYTILTYINYIANAWFGVNLFKDAGTKQFKDDLNSANNSAKELKKTLSGFDVAEVMGDTSSKSSQASGIPGLDLSNVKQIDVPDWVKWIAEHKDLIIGLAEIVGIAWGTSKVMSILGNIGKVFGVAGPAGAVGGSGLLGLGTSLASIVAIAGGIMIIAHVAKQTWDDINKLANEIDEITKKGQQVNQEWTKSIDKSAEVGKLTNKTRVNIQGGRDLLKESNSWWNKITGNSDKYLQAAKRVAENTGTNLEKTKEMWSYEKRTREEKEDLLNALKDQYEYNLDIIATLDQEGISTEEIRKENQKLLNQITIYTKELDNSKTNTNNLKDAWSATSKIIQGAKEDLLKLANQKIPDKSFNIKGKVKIDEGNLNTMIDKALTLYAGTNNQFFKTGFAPLVNAIKKYKAQYGLDGGGIVLPVPGHGVPVGANAIMSERRAEAVIPFENPEAMEKIGQAIGRWVNLSIDNKMIVDGRVLASSVNDTVSKENFLMNK